MARLYDWIQQAPAAPTDWVAADPQATMDWQHLRRRIDEYVPQFEACRGKPVGVAVLPRVDSIAVFAALDKLDASAVLMDGNLPRDQTCLTAADLGLERYLFANEDGAYALEHGSTAGPSADAQTGGVTILTSGTVGRPKAARHTWQSLLRPVRSSQQPQRWLLSYRLHLYAGLQVLLQSLATGGGVCMPGDFAPNDAVSMLIANGVEFASATPSYWRRLLLFADGDNLRKLSLRQLTLGGEAVDQPLLDRLRDTFPAARLIHIYATTELGRCFSVTDGKAGFPLSMLQPTEGPNAELRIEDGELLVRSKNRMEQYLANEGSNLQGFDDDGWFATGDQVEVHGDRVFFAGRLGDMINVGGNKVRPMVVENVVRQVSGVADVRIYGQTSSIAGELVACDIVVSPGWDPGEVQQAVANHCRETLTNFQWPRLIQVVESIPLSPAGKTRRKDLAGS